MITVVHVLTCVKKNIHLHRDICAFEDALRAGVYTSYNHFWSGKTKNTLSMRRELLFIYCLLCLFSAGFLAVVNGLHLRLRVGEVIPVKKRQVLVSRPLSKESTDMDDDDVDAVIQSFW